MDLVDIDKVLDDLELGEDERKCSSDANHSSSSLAAPTKSSPSIQQTSQNSYISIPASESNNNDKPNKSKSFVNITNVFNSLQEYVNVDIEHIIRAAEPLNEQSLQDELVEENEIGHRLVDSAATRDAHEDEEECTDIYPEDAHVGGLTSASSITTSSPSSFSSGPSPGSSSESSDIFTPDTSVSKLKENQNGEKQMLSGKQFGKSNPDSDLHSESTDLGSDDCGDGYVNPMDVDNIHLQVTALKNGDENSCELGLSSISSCLYNENTSSSFPGLSNDLCKLEGLSSIPSSTPKDSEDPEEAVDESFPNNEEQCLEVNTVNAQAKEGSREEANKATANADNIGVTQENKVEKQVVVVGFGSTMDEISDTELDSILQEIDSDMQIFNGSKNTEAASDAEKGIIIEPSEDRPDDIKALSTQNIEGIEKVVEEDKTKNIADHDDDCHENIANVDNFSQASTVEFAESRVQADFGHESHLTEPSSICDINASNATMSLDDGYSAKLSDEQNETTARSSSKISQPRPNSLDIPIQVNVNSTAGQTPPASAIIDENNAISNSSSDDLSPQSLSQETEGAEAVSTGPTPPRLSGESKLGKVPPFWIPDSEAPVCMQCQVKFSLIKRRHHCRACGLVLCSTCCSQKAKLEFFGDVEVRVCVQCHLILRERSVPGNETSQSSIETSDLGALNRPPNPNNPMEYCSMIPPHQQVTDAVATANPISVMVPVGVLKREGVPPKNNRKDKNVIFSDGIRPGCDLAELDENWDDKGESSTTSRKSGNTSRKFQMQSGLSSPPYHGAANSRPKAGVSKFVESDSLIPDSPTGLPPIYTKNITESELTEAQNDMQLISRLQSETLQFAIQRNFYVYVKIVKLKCCVNKTVINFTTRGMHHVGQDEIVILLEYDESSTTGQHGPLPKDIFIHLNQIYCQASKGRTINELGYSVPDRPMFLGSSDHGGFLYIRPTFQCLLELQLPDAPFLIGVLIHRCEIPWARVFPLRLMLRLGAQYRYYPSPHVSVPFREPVYGDIAQTIINFLADFRNYSYTLATIRGMYIHMEDRKTSVMIPRNRADQVVKALNNSSDHILALGGNLSKKADGHLVCIQNMESNCAESHTYSTQAINIQGQPRKVTGASFLVLNGALKSTSGLQGKCSIVEDGLMVQIMPAKMAQIRSALQNKQDIEIVCGPIDASESLTETVSIRWTDDDVEFNIDVKSPIDNKKMDGIPSIRVHSGLNFSNTSHIIRWTEVFIIQMENESPHNREIIDVQKVSEQIAKSASVALVSFLDLLAANGCVKIGLRVTLHQDNVCYETGSLNAKLPPLYMNALDNELIPTLHLQTSNLHGIVKPIILELIFYILDK